MSASESKKSIFYLWENCNPTMYPMGVAKAVKAPLEYVSIELEKV